ncbi:MAG: tryptophan--tRNA ligase [Candidatus Marinimicrobia bacterium]|nr:tryptophan--tRNA ligase [Candidatus Neomarinimicrobiota bacterium]
MAVKRILSGMRPTGKLHIGHYVGALESWVSLQGEYENYHLVADYHVLTTQLETESMLSNTIDMIKDWVAAGIDPEKSPIFRQSQIKEHAELYLLFSMLITKERLERNPSLKEQIRDLNLPSVIYGHLGYPVLQAADILLYRAIVVPVGEDQVSHIEITREIARKFNKTYGNVFPEPATKLTHFSRLPGLDGKAKMSKSLGNTVFLSDSPEAIWQAVRKAVTDTQKIRRNDPGRPDVCTIFTYHNVFNSMEIDVIRRDCESGALGCVDCKKNCAAKIASFFEAHREKRESLSDDMIMDILVDGETRARILARETMALVHDAMKLG